MFDEFKKKNPKTFWVIVAIVIILFISLIVGLIIGLKPKTTETTTETKTAEPTTEKTAEPTTEKTTETKTTEPTTEKTTQKTETTTEKTTEPKTEKTTEKTTETTTEKTETTTEKTTEKTETTVVQEKTLDEKISGIVNLPTVIENFDDGIIICSNSRNENYKEAILLFLDTLTEKNIEMLSFSKAKNIIVRDGDKIIMDMKEEKDKKDFLISELSRIRKLMKTLDKRFGKKTNYVHLLMVLIDYMGSILPPDPPEDKFMDVFAPILAIQIIMIPFRLYISNKLDWSDEFITYENSKFKVNQLEKMKNDERFKGGEIAYLSSMINDKSLREIAEIMLKQPRPNQPFKLLLNKINFENDDFINTFDSSNVCNIASDERWWEKTFKLKKMLQPERQSVTE